MRQLLKTAGVDIQKLNGKERDQAVFRLYRLLTEGRFIKSKFLTLQPSTITLFHKIVEMGGVAELSEFQEKGFDVRDIEKLMAAGLVFNVAGEKPDEEPGTVFVPVEYRLLYAPDIMKEEGICGLLNRVPLDCLAKILKTLNKKLDLQTVLLNDKLYMESRVYELVTENAGTLRDGLDVGEKIVLSELFEENGSVDTRYDNNFEYYYDNEFSRKESEKASMILSGLLYPVFRDGVKACSFVMPREIRETLFEDFHKRNLTEKDIVRSSMVENANDGIPAGRDMLSVLLDVRKIMVAVECIGIRENADRTVNRKDYKLLGDLVGLPGRMVDIVWKFFQKEHMLDISCEFYRLNKKGWDYLELAFDRQMSTFYSSYRNLLNSHEIKLNRIIADVLLSLDGSADYNKLLEYILLDADGKEIRKQLRRMGKNFYETVETLIRDNYLIGNYLLVMEGGKPVNIQVSKNGFDVLNEKPLTGLNEFRDASGVSRIIVQPNCEIIAPLETQLGVLKALSGFCSLKRIDNSFFFEISRDSILKGLENGVEASSMTSILEASASNQVPQTVTYQIQNTVELFGKLRMGYSCGYIHSDDHELLDEIRLQNLVKDHTLKDSADSVLLVDGKVEMRTIYKTLRKSGYHPLFMSTCENQTGKVVTCEVPQMTYAKILDLFQSMLHLVRESRLSLDDEKYIREIIQTLTREGNRTIETDGSSVELLKRIIEKASYRKFYSYVGEFTRQKRAISFYEGLTSAHGKRNVRALLSYAVKNNLPVRIFNQSESGRDMSRVVEPLDIDDVFVEAYCSVVKEKRRFRTDTITRVEFVPPEEMAVLKK